MLDHVESHSLGEGSTRHTLGEWGTCTGRWSQHHLPSRRSKESSERGCYDVSSHNYTMTLHINVYRLYFFTYLRLSRRTMMVRSILVEMTRPFRIAPRIDTEEVNGHFLSMYFPRIAISGVLMPRPISAYQRWLVFLPRTWTLR